MIKKAHPQLKPPARKWPQSKVAGQPPVRPATSAHQFRPSVAQLKHPAAPPIYKPQPLQAVLQTKRVVGVPPHARGSRYGGTIQRSSELNGVVKFKDLKNRKNLAIWGPNKWYPIPADAKLGIGDKVSFDAKKEGAVSNVKVTGQDDGWGAFRKHPDLSKQINLKTVKVKPTGSRATAHHLWKDTLDVIRDYDGPVNNTYGENEARNGWKYSIPFEEGSIIFSYNDKADEIQVFHSYNEHSG